MPKKEVDYSKTCIYKFVCLDPAITDCYVGHTTSWDKRKSCHKGRCNNETDKKHHFKIYKFMRENGGFENWTMLKICDYPCSNKYQASIQEHHYIKELNATLNSNTPTRTQQQWNIDNSEKIKQYQKQYNEKNKDKILQKRKEYFNNLPYSFSCEACNFKCKTKQHYNNHLKTGSHLDNTEF